MSDEIKSGDTVRLKSGGPVMTVSEIGDFIGENGIKALCVWFDGKQLRKEHLSLESIEKAEPESGPELV